MKLAKADNVFQLSIENHVLSIDCFGCDTELDRLEKNTLHTNFATHCMTQLDRLVVDTRCKNGPRWVWKLNISLGPGRASK
jgi:hypothetical protein